MESREKRRREAEELIKASQEIDWSNVKLEKVEAQPYASKGGHVFWQPEQKQQFMIVVRDKEEFLKKYGDRKELKFNFVTSTMATMVATEKDFESIVSDVDLIRYEMSRPVFPM